jgi:very-short-patch-repair endonuclease
MTHRQRVLKIVRELRKNQTPEEELLWNELRNRKLNGIKFFRQHPITYGFYKSYLFFVADFYCAEHKFIIELDGKYHEHQKEKDQSREEAIKEKGLRVLRIKNEEMKSIEKVKEKILETAASL